MTFPRPASCYHASVRRVVVLFALGVAVAGADTPKVEIRSRTQLALTRVRIYDEGLVQVSGQLADKLTGEPIPNQKVEVTIAGQHRYGTTGPDGEFQVSLPGAAGTQAITLSYAGYGPIDRAETVTVSTDPAKSHVALAIAKLVDDPLGARLRITAVAEDGGPVTVPVAVAVAPAGGDTFYALRTTPTGSEFVLARKDAGGPGTYRVRAAFAGDDTRQAATVEATLELVSSTTTTLAVKSTALAFEDDLVASGNVTDDDGRPVARAAVTLTSGDKRLAQSITGDDGGYKFRIEAEILGEGQRGIQVQADPVASYVKPSRSPPEVITIAAPQPVPVSYTVAAFGLTALAAGGFFLARTKPWRRLRRQAPPAEVPSQQGEVEVPQGGLVVAKPGLVSTLRRANDDGFAGVVRDTVRGRPIAEAVVRVLFGDTERELRTAADGSFAIEKLGVGEWRAEVAAPGHVTERFAVTIPHRGELRGVRIDLVPVRERVFQLYRRAAEPVLPEPRLWGIWSPRQIVDHVRTKRPTPALAELTDFVEEIYFSPRLAAETVLHHASERVDRAIHERTRTAAR